MHSKMDEDFLYEVFGVIEEIPEGNVATYGQIAKLTGREKNSRLVGKALSYASMYGDYPCHRVVNSSGRLVPGWMEQKELLLGEGISLKENGTVDLKKYQWRS